MPTLKPLDAARPSVTVLVGIVLLTAILSLAQGLLIPIALAILLTFILAPAVVALQRRRVSRTWSVLIVVLAAFVCIGGGLFIITSQLHQLASDLPAHRENVKRKMQDLQQGQGVIQELGTMLDEIASGFKPTTIMIPVSFRSDQKTGLETMQSVAEPVIHWVGSVGLVIAMTITMLFKREDLRNRLIRLAGHRQMTSTTRAIDEATQRISRYLVIQVAINAGFGAVLALGLAVLGVPYALLWGILAMIVRFIPYIGTWLAAVPPLVVSVAVSDGWFQPSAVVLFVLALGLFINNVLEPLLVSRTTGVSPIALVVAAAFWTWLWGPIGLVLSTPITVCLRVLGRYVPSLEFLDILFGNEPALDPRFGYYQRLLAHDEAEAAEVVETFLQDHNRLELCEQVLVPTLVCMKEDQQLGNLGADDVQYIIAATRELLEEVAWPDSASDAPSRPGILVLGCPAKDDIDDLALEIFARVAGDEYRLERLSTKLMAGEILEQVRQQRPSSVLIAAIPPGGLARIRYLCKRLHAEFPTLRIAVACWGLPADEQPLVDSLRDAGANHVSLTMSDSLRQLQGFLPLTLDAEPLLKA